MLSLIYHFLSLPFSASNIGLGVYLQSNKLLCNLSRIVGHQVPQVMIWSFRVNHRHFSYEARAHPGSLNHLSNNSQNSALKTNPLALFPLKILNGFTFRILDGFTFQLFATASACFDLTPLKYISFLSVPGILEYMALCMFIPLLSFRWFPGLYSSPAVSVSKSFPFL